MIIYLDTETTGSSTADGGVKLLELTRLVLRSGRRLTAWYQNFSEPPFTVDKLDING